MLINIKMPTIVEILTFIRMVYFQGADQIALTYRLMDIQTDIGPSCSHAMKSSSLVTRPHNIHIDLAISPIVSSS